MYPNTIKTVNLVKLTEELLNGKIHFLGKVISTRDHCQKLSSPEISKKPLAWFEFDQNLGLLNAVLQ